VHQFHRDVTDTVLQALTAPCRRADPSFNTHYLDSNVEQSVWLLVTTKPDNLLPPDHVSWDSLLLASADRVVDAYLRDPDGFTWGEVNVANIHHPLTGVLGPLAKWLKTAMPAEPLPGDTRGMPRIQGPSVGASQRMAVSPGREEQGYYHAPAGQSGHPLSPHFRDGHDDWVKGRPTPLLPGPAVSVLELRPAR
jgi:penicillin amidase